MVNIRPFPGATIKSIHDYIKPVLKKRFDDVISHVGAYDTSRGAVRSVLVTQCCSYPQWRLMGSTLIVDDPELAPVLFGTCLPTSEGWKPEFA